MALTATSAPRPPARNVSPRVEAWLAFPSTVTLTHHKPGRDRHHCQGVRRRRRFRDHGGVGPIAPLGQIAGADGGAVHILLARGGGESQVPLEPETHRPDRLDRHRLGDQRPLHVAGAPAVDSASLDLAAQGISGLPGLGQAGGNRIDMSIEEQRLAPAGSLPDAGQIGPFRLYLPKVDFHSELPVVSGQVLIGSGFTPDFRLVIGPGVTRIDAANPDQFADGCHNFLLHAVNDVQNAALFSLGSHSVLLFQGIPTVGASLSPFAAVAR